MSNILYIEKIKFVGSRDISYGMKIYDNYGKDYDNNLSKEEFDNLTDDDKLKELAEELFPDFFIDDQEVYSKIEVIP